MEFLVYLNCDIFYQFFMMVCIVLSDTILGLMFEMDILLSKLHMMLMMGYSLFLRIYSCRTQHGYICMGKGAEVLANYEAEHSCCCSLHCGKKSSEYSYVNMLLSFLFPPYISKEIYMCAMVFQMNSWAPCTVSLSVISYKWDPCFVIHMDDLIVITMNGRDPKMVRLERPWHLPLV